jgi:hypothetical protein
MCSGLAQNGCGWERSVTRLGDGMGGGRALSRDPGRSATAVFDFLGGRLGGRAGRRQRAAV